MSTSTSVNFLRDLNEATVGPAELAGKPAVQGRRRRIPTALVWDLAMLLGAGGAALLLAPVLGQPALPVAWVAAFCAIVLMGLANRGVYSDRSLGPHLLDRVRTVASATAVATMVVVVARVIAVDDPHTASQLALCWVLATTALLAGRVGLYRIELSRIRSGAGRPTLIVGAGKVGHLVAHRLVQNREFGLKPVGFLDSEPLGSVEGEVPLPVLGGSWNLEQVIADQGVEHVIFSFSTAHHEELLAMARRCVDLGVTVSQVPRLFEATVERMTVEHLGGLPIVTLHPADPRGWQFAVKYALDRCAAFALMVAISPLLLAIAVAAKVSTKGPVLFRQARIGRDGAEFEMLKFRTMRGEPAKHGESDADWAAEILGTGNGDRPDHLNGAASNGSQSEDRRTAIGTFLRRYSLDELPQIWNVVRGDMSLIGPRPERARYARRFERAVHRYGDRHRVKSGITGWAQVNGLRGKTSLADRVEWDNHYIENWSLWLDTKILILTVGALFHRTGE